MDIELQLPSLVHSAVPNSDIEAFMELLPADILLKIYDYFLDLRVYLDRRRIESIKSLIDSAMDSVDYVHEFSIETISTNVPFAMKDLPPKIGYSYDLLNLFWKDLAEPEWGDCTIEKRSFHLKECGTELEFYRLRIWDEQGSLDILYDTQTFQKVKVIHNELQWCNRSEFYMDEVLNYVRRSFVHSCKGCDIYVDNVDEVHEYNRLLQKLSEADDNTTLVSSNDGPECFIELRCVLHQECVK